MFFTYRPVTKVEAWPEDIVPAKQTLQLLTSTSRMESPFGRYAQTQETPGAIWKLSASFNLTKDQADELRAFQAKLRGTSGFFYFKAEPSVFPVFGQAVSDQGLTFFSDPDRPHLVGTNGATRAITAGWTDEYGAPAPAGTKVLGKGEYISFDDKKGYRQLHLSVEDAFLDENGLAEFAVEPPIYVATPGTDLMWECPSSMFHLAADEDLAITELPGGEYTATVSAMQAFCPDVSWARFAGNGGDDGMGYDWAGRPRPLPGTPAPPPPLPTSPPVGPPVAQFSIDAQLVPVQVPANITYGPDHHSAYTALRLQVTGPIGWIPPTQNSEWLVEWCQFDESTQAWTDWRSASGAPAIQWSPAGQGPSVGMRFYTDPAAPLNHQLNNFDGTQPAAGQEVEAWPFGGPINDDVTKARLKVRVQCNGATFPNWSNVAEAEGTFTNPGRWQEPQWEMPAPALSRTVVQTLAGDFPIYSMVLVAEVPAQYSVQFQVQGTSTRGGTFSAGPSAGSPQPTFTAATAAGQPSHKATYTASMDTVSGTGNTVTWQARTVRTEWSVPLNSYQTTYGPWTSATYNFTTP